MAAINPENLRMLMERSGITPIDLAERCDISLSYMTRILSGERTLARNLILRRRIAENLHVPQFMIEARDESAVA